jgi:hypothetical protein
MKSSLGEKQTKIIIKQRNRIYWNVITLDFLTKQKKYLQFKEKDLKILTELKEKGIKVIKEYFSKGSEIVKEIVICNKCK